MSHYFLLFWKYRHSPASEFSCEIAVNSPSQSETQSDNKLSGEFKHRRIKLCCERNCRICIFAQKIFSEIQDAHLWPIESDLRLINQQPAPAYRFPMESPVDAASVWAEPNTLFLLS